MLLKAMTWLLWRFRRPLARFLIVRYRARLVAAAVVVLVLVAGIAAARGDSNSE